jgi:hypothetical protein
MMNRMNQLKSRKFLDNSIKLNPQHPKKYYLHVFEDIIREIQANKNQVDL